MVVLSLCDGISCGNLALERVGADVTRYLASEVNESAIKCTQYHFPEVEQIGDMSYIDKLSLFFDGVSQVDLLLCGSPCQGFSFAGKRLNFDDPRSKLFFEFVRILHDVKPKFFLFENVKMKWEWEDIITRTLGVPKKTVSSSKVSAQDRTRNYWCNWHWDAPIEDSDIELKHILETKTQEPIPSRLVNRNVLGGRDPGILVERLEMSRGKRKSHTILSSFEHKVGLASDLDDLGLNSKFYAEYGVYYRPYSIIERERLQTLPDDYTAMLSLQDRHHAVGNCWTVDMISHIISQNKNLTCT